MRPEGFDGGFRLPSLWHSQRMAGKCMIYSPRGSYPAFAAH